MAGAADTAKLIAELSLKDKFSAGAKTAMGSLDKLESKFSKIGGIASKGLQAAARSAAVVGVAAATALAGLVGSGVRSLAELSQIQEQTNAVIASTGGKAGVTAGQVRDLANALEDVTTVDDKVIQSGENILLTFTNIGAGAFPLATKAMVDMAVAMNGGSTEGLDLKSTAIQLGKALNDPVKGIAALTRVGVTFTQEQFEQIVALKKSGDLLGAQKIILKELETEFGKAGEAAGRDYGSDMRRVQDAVEEVSKVLASALMPLITRVAKFLKEKLTDPAVLAKIKTLGDSLATAGTKILEFIGKVNWSQLFDQAAEGLGKARDAAVTIFDTFNKLPDWVKNAVITGWGLNTVTGGALTDLIGALGSGLIKGVLGMTAGVVNIAAGVVNGGGGSFVDDVGRTATGIGLAGAAFIGAVGGAGLAIAAGISDWLQKNFLVHIEDGKLVLPGGKAWPGTPTDTWNGNLPSGAFDRAGGVEFLRGIQTSEENQETLLRNNLQRPQVAPNVNVAITNNISSREVVSGAVTTSITSTGMRTSGGGTF